MSKATLIPHIHDEPHADEGDWQAVKHLVELYLSADAVSRVLPVLTALAGGSVIARFDVTDPDKPTTIIVRHDGISFNTVDRPTVTKEP